jgi:hypothetical protein
MTIDINPEFGYELACSIPYANWLKENGQEVIVVTSKGMRPFYWFCDEVVEKHTYRSIDNSTNGVQNLPNTWVHHNALANFGKDYSELTEEDKIKANGWLDYSKWSPPAYRKRYLDTSLELPENYIVISNRYNLEHGQEPIGYFDIESLNTIFNLLSEKGYNVVYKRPNNTEFTTDPNELRDRNITANVKGVGTITDYQLTSFYNNVFLFDDLVKSIGRDYNTSQLNIFSKAQGFISMGGGSSILCSYFEKPVIIYVNTSKDIRPGYFDDNSYFRKLSGAPIYPVVDTKDSIIQRGWKDYSKVYKYIKEVL